jgi:hypothetical protein
MNFKGTIQSIAAVLMVAAMAACSSTPVSTTQASETKDRTTAEQLAPNATRTLETVVIHDRLFVPTPIRPKVFVDGALLGTIGQSEKITFYLAPGNHRFGWSALTEGNYREQEFIVSPDQKCVFHLVSPAGDVLRFIREN